MTVAAKPLVTEEPQMQTEWNARAALVESLLMQEAIPFIPEGRPGLAPQPIEVRGEPVSETIIVERRQSVLAESAILLP